MSDQAWREKATIERVASGLIEARRRDRDGLDWYCDGIGDALCLWAEDVYDLSDLTRTEIVVGLSRLISRRDSGES